MRQSVKSAIQKKIANYRMHLTACEAMDDFIESSLYRTAGLVLKDIRAEKNISQKQLCDQLQLNQSTYSAIENGKYNTGLHRYYEILLFLDIDFTSFIDRIKQKHEQLAKGRKTGLV